MMHPPIPEDANHKRFTLSGRARSFRYAGKGIAILLGSQHNAWFHAGATVAVCGVGLQVGITKGEWCWIVLAMVAVWSAEAFNTALELLADVASPGHHPLVAKAKDVAAGAVLISAIGAVVVGAIVFWPYLRGV